MQAKAAKVGAAFNKIGQIGLAVAGTLGGAFAATIKWASDASEGLNKFNAVFGQQAIAAEKFATTLASTVGRSKTEIRDAMSAFQGFFVGLGFAPDKARELSQQMAALSLDFASFHNLSDQEAMERFISALSGSSEVLDRFGINTKQAALEQELLRMGVHKSWTEVTESEKAIARLNVIMQSMTAQGAMGDAVKTAGSFANQLKALQAKLKDTAIQIGTTLLPVATQWLGKLREIAAAAADWVAKNSELFVSLATFTVKLAAASMALIGIAKVIGGVTVVVHALRTAISFLSAHPLVALATAVAAVAIAFAHWMGWLDKVYEKLGKFMGALPDATADINAMTEAIERQAAAEAKRQDLQNRIAGNRAATGNPWGITGDRPPVGASGPDSDPLGFAMVGPTDEAKAALRAAKDAWESIKRNNPLAGMADSIKEKFNALLHPGPNAPAEIPSMMVERLNQPEAFFDPRLIRQAWGGSEDIQRRQLQTQRDMLSEMRRKKGGLSVI